MAERQPPEQGQIHTGPIRETGITILYTPAAPVVDICFVHGFTGNPEATWTSSKSPMNTRELIPESEEPSQAKKRSIKRGNHPRTSNDAPSAAKPVYWPRGQSALIAAQGQAHLLPSLLPHARIFTFGYDTQIGHPFNKRISQNSLSDHADTFLWGLESVRRGSPNRPLIFVAHSLGGLLVKDVLRASELCKASGIRSDYYKIYESTSALFFFGTPHMGVDITAKSFFVPLVRAFGFEYNQNIVETLKLGGERLRLLASDFARLTNDRRWHIYTFQEEYGCGVSGNKIVPDYSSSINDHIYEQKTHILANHVDMCKFNGFDDPEFSKVSAALLREGALPNTTSVMLSPQKNSAILEKLKFDSMDARFNKIEGAQRGTCQWLPRHHSYKSWVDPSQMNRHHGFLWIKGKAGTGKSTSMKWLCRNTEQKKKGCIVLKFFFNARGDNLEHSTEGMYRSLLYQLINALPGTNFVAEPLSPLLTLNDTAPWPIEPLKEAFSSVLAQARSHELYCFIDALDECPETEIRDMLEFFQDVGESSVASKANIRVCIASRQYPRITIRYGLELVLEVEDDHAKDIRHYIHSRLILTDNRQRREIEDEVFDRSSRIFLSAKLIIDILNKENDIGGNVRVCERLSQIPRELYDLFHDILTRDNENLEQMIRCLQWILFAKKPLSPEELYFAIKIGNGSNTAGIWDRDIVLSDSIDRFNLNAHKGLAEDFSDSNLSPRRVQFIHESVRDYLKSDGLQKLVVSWQLGLTLSEGPSHDILRNTCLKQINEGYILQMSTHDARTLTNMPFFHYAAYHVLAHADSAQSFHSEQLDFLNNFPTENWVHIRKRWRKEESRQYAAGVDLLYVLAELDLDNLISIHPQRYFSFERPRVKQRFSSPLVAAMAFGNKQAIIALALGAAEGSSQTQSLDQIMSELVRNVHRFTKSISASRWKKIDVFSVFCSLGSVSLIAAVLHRILATMNVSLKQAMKELQCATNVDVCRYLIANGFDITAKNKAGETAFVRAVKDDELETAEFLLAAHADLNATEPLEIPSLDHIKSGSMACLLMKHGACVGQDISRLMKKTIADDFLATLQGMRGDKFIGCLGLSPQVCQETVLHSMLRDGDERVLPLLYTALTHDSKLANLRDDHGDSLLKLAASHNDLEALRVLCEASGADFNSRNQDGCTPLCGAVVSANYTSVKILLELGARSSHVETDTGCYPLRKAIHKEKPPSDDQMAVLKTLLRLPSTRVDFALVSEAILSTSLEIFQLFLPLYRMSDNYSGINEQGVYGDTLLSTAARAGNADIVRLLLSTDAEDINVNCVNTNGLPPLSVAIDSKRVEVVKVLLDVPAVNVNYQTSDCGVSPNVFAIQTGNLEIFERLLYHRSIDCNLETFDGCTPLYEAVTKGRLDMARGLLSHPFINLNFDDSLDRNPVLWAAKYGTPQALQLLLMDPRINKQQRCYDGKSISELAADNKNPNVLKLVQHMQ
ncbi:hypothetical protein O1611_g1436 [Lasiodiplodia mahajangana]|uniref:Uncharacterized protein n=1 Tax=Lasiodiplodia mahajangana TaxID=1108764 RepID=A0ACC2JXZ7_9PEZI|nr:hypothetical protein O1611_g1436 [Lasiodiplodia mahajangana]